MKKIVAAAVLPLLVGATSPEERTRSDLRCILALTQLAKMDKPEFQQAGMMASLYYIGRLDGRVPDLDLEGALEREFKAMTPPEYGPLLQSCGATMQGRGAKISEIGANLSKKGL
jgi:hypothetical protein